MLEFNAAPNGASFFLFHSFYKYFAPTEHKNHLITDFLNILDLSTEVVGHRRK